MKFLLLIGNFGSILSLISGRLFADDCFETCRYNLLVLPFFQSLPNPSISCPSVCTYEKCSTGCSAWTYRYHPNCDLQCNAEFNCVQGCNFVLNHFIQNFSSQISPISVMRESSTQFSISWNISTPFVFDYNQFSNYTNWLPQWRLANSSYWNLISATNQLNTFSYDRKGRFDIGVSSLMSDGTVLSPETVVDIRVVVSIFDQITFTSNVVEDFHTEFTQDVIPHSPVIKFQQPLLDQSILVCWEKSLLTEISYEVELIRASETVFKTVVGNASCFVATEIGRTGKSTLQITSVTKSARRSQPTALNLELNSSKLKKKRRRVRMVLAATTGVYLLDNLTDFTVPKSPVLLSSAVATNPVVGVAANDGFVFVAHQNGLIDQIGLIDPQASQSFNVSKPVFQLTVDWLNEKLYLAANTIVIRRGFRINDEKSFNIPKLKQGSVLGFTADSINGYLYFSDSICIYRIPMGKIDKDMTECIFKLTGLTAVPIFLDLTVDFALLFPSNNSIFALRLDTLTVSDIRDGKLRDPTKVSYSNVVGIQRHQGRLFWIDNRCSLTNVGSCLFGEENLPNSGQLNTNVFLLDPKFGKLIDAQLTNISDYPVYIAKPENFNILASQDTVNVSWSSTRLPFQANFEWRTLNYSIGVQMGQTMLHSQWTLGENYKLNDQNPDTKYQTLAEVCWGATRLCSQITNKSVTTLIRGLHLEMIVITKDNYYQKISSTGEIIDSHQIFLPGNDEVSVEFLSDLIYVSDDTQYVALVVTKRHKLYGITVRNQLSNLRSFTNESYDVFAVSYDPNGKGIYWLSSFGVFRTSLGGNDTNMIYRTSVWNPCQWIKVLPKRALIVVGCDYTLTAIGYTGATLLKYYDCNPGKQNCGSLLGYAMDESADRILYLLQEETGVSLRGRYYSEKNWAAVTFPSFPSIRHLEYMADRFVFITTDNRIGIAPRDNLTEINFLSESYGGFALVAQSWNLQVTPDSPKDLSFTTEPDGSLVVSWTAVAKPKDAMVFYNVSVQTMDDYSLLGLFITEKPSQRIPELEGSTQLKICVSALTYWQQSPPNCTIHTTPIGDPGVPKNPRIYLLTTRTLESGGDMRTSAIFEWDEPSFAGPPGWYKAECLQQNTLLKEVILPAGLTRISLENLPTGIVISCQVRTVRNESHSAKTEPVTLVMSQTAGTSGFSHLIVVRNDPNKPTTSVTNLNLKTMTESTIGTILGQTKLAAGIFASREIYLIGSDWMKVMKLTDDQTKFSTQDEPISKYLLSEVDSVAIDWLGRRLFLSSSAPKSEVHVWELDAKQLWNISGFAEPILDISFDPLTSTLFWTAQQQINSPISLMEMNVGPLINDRQNVRTVRDEVRAVRVPNCPPAGVKIISGALGLKGDIQRNIYSVTILTDNGFYSFSLPNECIGPIGPPGLKVLTGINKILPIFNDFYWTTKDGKLLNNVGLTQVKPVVDTFRFGPEFQFYPNPNCLVLNPPVPKIEISSEGNTKLTILSYPESPGSCAHISRPQTEYIYEARKITSGSKNVSASPDLRKTFYNRETLIVPLIPNAEYNIQVAWRNFYSPKELPFTPAETIHSLPPQQAPGPPEMVTKVGGIFKWKPPASSGGAPLLGYLLQYRKDSNSPWIKAKLDKENSTEWKPPSDLKPSDYTEVAVAAYNSLGRSPFATVQKGESNNIISVIIGVIFGIIVMALIAAAVIYVVYKKRRDSTKDPYRHEIKPRGSSGDLELSSRESSNRITQLVAKEELDALPHVPRSCITIARMLGKGAFGEVFEGLACNIPRLGPKTTRVAIKTLRTGCSESERVKFLKEAILMSNFTHPNIVKLLGVCLESEPHWLILELMEGGDLLSYLRSVRPTEVLPSQVSLRDLLSICVDVAKGCEYLEQNHHVHRDLAARNCLITTKDPQNRVVKIADFGLTRDVYEGDYYRVEGQGLLPVRWMAPESMIDGVFTLKTDVWSFGVIMWEVFSLGQQPYMSRSNWDVINYVRIGGRLPSPEFCPTPIYDVILSCWAFQSAQRPQFGLILERLVSLYRNSLDQAEFPFPPSAPVGGYLSTGSREVSQQSAAKETNLPSDLRTPKQSHFVRGTGGNQSTSASQNKSNRSSRRSIFRSGRKEKVPPPVPPSKAQLEPQSPTNSLRVPQIEKRPTSSTSSARESYTTNQDCYEVPLVKYNTSNTDYVTREMAKLQAQNGQSPSRSSPRNLNLHRGADNLAYEPTSPTSLTDIGGPKEEDDYELANSIKEQLKGQRYTPSPHQSLKSESIQNSPNSARKMPQEKIAQVERIAVIPSERLPQRPARRLTKETTFDAISTAEPATSVNFVDSSRHSGGHGVNNESFRM